MEVEDFLTMLRHLKGFERTQDRERTLEIMRIAGINDPIILKVIEYSKSGKNPYEEVIRHLWVDNGTLLAKPAKPAKRVYKTPQPEDSDMVHRPDIDVHISIPAEIDYDHPPEKPYQGDQRGDTNYNEVVDEIFDLIRDQKKFNSEVISDNLNHMNINTVKSIMHPVCLALAEHYPRNFRWSNINRDRKRWLETITHPHNFTESMISEAHNFRRFRMGQLINTDLKKSYVKTRKYKIREKYMICYIVMNMMARAPASSITISNVMKEVYAMDKTVRKSEHNKYEYLCDKLFQRLKEDRGMRYLNGKLRITGKPVDVDFDYLFGQIRSIRINNGQREKLCRIACRVHNSSKKGDKISRYDIWFTGIKNHPELIEYSAEVETRKIIGVIEEHFEVKRLKKEKGSRMTGYIKGSNAKIDPDELYIMIGEYDNRGRQQ